MLEADALLAVKCSAHTYTALRARLTRKCLVCRLYSLYSWHASAECLGSWSPPLAASTKWCAK